MTNFAQALARIEELHATTQHAPVNSVLYVTALQELQELALQHADSIVQLGKVAAEMRGLLPLLDDPRDYRDTAKTYDKLMKEGEG